MLTSKFLSKNKKVKNFFKKKHTNICVKYFA